MPVPGSACNGAASRPGMTIPRFPYAADGKGCDNHRMTHDFATQSGIPDRLTAVLTAQPDIVFATLFGSVAKGTARADSDLDVGVLANAPLTAQRKQQLIVDFAVASGRPVDLVDLRDAGPVVLASALQGLGLVGGGSAAHAALLSRALTDAADFLPVRERILRERRDAWTS